MKLRERLEIRREAKALYRAKRSEGLDDEAAAEAVLDVMEEKYGLTVDWAKIMELVMLLLSLFMKETQ